MKSLFNYSLDMILQDRFEDPERILIGLGFGGGQESQAPIDKIPERFLSKQSTLGQGLDLSSLLEGNQELTEIFQQYNDIGEHGQGQTPSRKSSAGNKSDSKFKMLLLIYRLFSRSVPIHFLKFEHLQHLIAIDPPEVECGMRREYDDCDMSCPSLVTSGSQSDLEMSFEESEVKLTRPTSLDIRYNDMCNDQGISPESFSSTPSVYTDLHLSPDESLV